MTSGIQASPQKTVLYGCGGIGKTSLIASVKEVGTKVLLLDLEGGSSKLDVARISGIASFDELRDCLHDDAVWDGFDGVGLDSFTLAEELAAHWTVANVKHEKGHTVSSVEGFGFGKGYTHVYETFLTLLGDLDAHQRQGRRIFCTAHDCIAEVPNPAGEDFLQWQPRLQSPNSGKASIRLRVREWADHLLFIGYDVAVGEDGKGKGTGTRCIYPTELPTHMAKSRSLSEPIVYERDSAELWNQLFGEK